MPGTENEATEQDVPTTEVGATEEASDNTADKDVRILDDVADSDEPETSDNSEEEDSTDEAGEADEAGDAESDDQPDDGEPELVSLEQYEEEADDLESGDNTDDLSEFEIPELDEDATKNVERWNQQWQGIAKREKGIREQEAAINLAYSIDSDLQSKEGTERLLARIQEHGRKKFGMDFSESQRATELENDNDHQSNWWESDDDDLPASTGLEVTPDLAKKVFEQFGIDPDTIRELATDKAKAKEEIAFQSTVNTALPEVNQRLQSNYSGLQVTPEVLAKAMKARPGYKPYDAVVSYYEKPLMQRVKQSIKSPKKKMPTQPKGSAGRVQGPEANLESILNVRLLD